MDEFFTWLGAKKSAGIRLAVMDMWKAFRNSTITHAPQASILFDKECAAAHSLSYGESSRMWSGVQASLLYRPL